MTTEPFRVVVADPPWPFNDPLPGRSRGAEKNYQLMNLRQIMDYPLPELSKDAVLFLWKVSAIPEAPLQVCRAWGFRPYTEMVWRKLTVKGKPWFGMGRMIRNSHESVLVGVRGIKAPQAKSHSIRSVFEAPYAGHSTKPEAFYDIVEELFDGPYLELFARRRRAGWTCEGNEL